MLRDNGPVEDLYALLGLPPGASPAEVTAAFRRLAKTTHPDTASDETGATTRMAELNAAYDSAMRRRGLRQARSRDRRQEGPGEAAAGQAHRSRLGARLRAALGEELLDALEPREAVELVTTASTWASPRTVLAVTDRRLLWLHDDAVLGRVRSVRFRDVAAARLRMSWPRRRRATLLLRGRDGRRQSFSGLQPQIATRIAHAVRSARPAT